MDPEALSELARRVPGGLVRDLVLGAVGVAGVAQGVYGLKTGKVAGQEMDKRTALVLNVIAVVVGMGFVAYALIRLLTALLGG